MIEIEIKIRITVDIGFGNVNIIDVGVGIDKYGCKTANPVASLSEQACFLRFIYNLGNGSNFQKPKTVCESRESCLD